MSAPVAMTDAVSLRLFGTVERPVVPRLLHAGALSCEFEGGGLRHVRWGDVEIARGIHYLFRDRDWGTATAVVGDLRIVVGGDRFTVDFTLGIATDEGDLRATACIEGEAGGRLSFRVDATPDADLLTSRCGFVLLHPSACAGRPLTVVHTDDRVEATAFPLTISPSQPVFDIRGLRYSPVDGVNLHCRLEAELPGDPRGKFEMEDQRNWTDASFKTYVGSLLDPWPYRLAAGVTQRQQVAIEVTGMAANADAEADTVHELRPGTPGAVLLPSIGIGVPPGLHRATAQELAALGGAGAGWWLIDATLDDADLPQDLATVAVQRAGLSVHIQLDAVVPEGMDADEAATLAAALCRKAGVAVDAVRLLPAALLKSYQPSDAWPVHPSLEAHAQAARRAFPSARVGGGIFTYFTELNRNRPSAEGLDFIGHATCPIVHAADDVSVMQTLQALDAVTRSVAALWPGLAYRLGPSTIASPRNPYGRTAVPNPDLRRIPLANADPRHRGQFGAAWTLGHAAAVAHAGLDLLALHHSHGANGPFGGGDSIVPAWAVLRRLAAASGARWVPLEGLTPGIAGLAWIGAGGRVEGLVANLGTQALRFRWGEAGEETVLQSFEVLALK